MKTWKIAVFAVLCGLSAFGQAQVIGNYAEMNRDTFLRLQREGKTAGYVLAGKEYGKNMWFCADFRKVPGKLVDGNCFVPWKGKQYVNSSYYVLLNPPSGTPKYQLGNPSGGQEMVTAGGMEWGDFTFHCVVHHYKYSLSLGSPQTYRITHSIAGKYYSTDGRSYGCEIPWNGKSYTHWNVHEPNPDGGFLPASKLEVLVAPWW